MSMRRKAWLAALAVTIAGGLIPTAAAATETQTAAGSEAAMSDHRRDLAAFERILKRQEAAWAAEDGTAFAATFTEDGDVVTFNGDHLAGRLGIAAGLQHAFDVYIPPSRIVRLDEHVRFVERDLAIVVRTSCIVNAGEEACRAGSHSRNTNVLRVRRGEWLQTSFQNTRIEPLP
jgi:uncharacterized protein (TIGR02246 family)